LKDIRNRGQRLRFGPTLDPERLRHDLDQILDTAL
jgi:hypothetical protein